MSNRKCRKRLWHRSLISQNLKSLLNSDNWKSLNPITLSSRTLSRVSSPCTEPTRSSMEASSSYWTPSSTSLTPAIWKMASSSNCRPATSRPRSTSHSNLDRATISTALNKLWIRCSHRWSRIKACNRASTSFHLSLSQFRTGITGQPNGPPILTALVTAWRWISHTKCYPRWSSGQGSISKWIKRLTMRQSAPTALVTWPIAGRLSRLPHPPRSSGLPR